MKQGGGRSKGATFERTVSKMIVEASKHLGVRQQDCYRTPMSGGHPNAKYQHPSDLVMSKKLLKHFSVSVECKHYKKVDLQTLFTKTGLVFSWVAQASHAALHSNDDLTPLVVFKWNNSQVFCIFPVGSLPRPNHQTYMRFFYKKQYWHVVLFQALLDEVFKGGLYKC